MLLLPHQMRCQIDSFLHLCGLVPPLPGLHGASQWPTALPLVDVRSPGEFLQGHIPGAVNIPLFTDAERAEVGTLYKAEGRQKAVLHGLACIGPRLDAMAESILALCGPGGEIALYCSRGGMRSASVAWLLHTLEVKTHVLDGGYKSFRRHVLGFFSSLPEAGYDFHVLGGQTGSGKTEVLLRMADKQAQVIDLEGMAEHKGSAFGWLEGRVQPTNEHFENCLATALWCCDPASPVWVEDECENLGSVNLPRPFFHCLRNGRLVILEVSRSSRLSRVLQEYGSIPQQRMADAVDRIRKRLGGLEHKKAREALRDGDLAALADILLAYYDKAYAKQLRSRTPSLVVRTDDVLEAAGRFCRG